MAFRAFPSPFDCLLFDLDDTLYSSNTGIGKGMKQNIEDFLASKCNVSAERAYTLRAELFRSYGSSLAGLIALGYDVHPDEYHSVAHGRLPYEVIKPNPQLRKLLLSIPQTKILFTNSDRQHAKRVLERLGIEEECFHKIICFETMNQHLFSRDEANKLTAESSQVILKPSMSAMEIAVNLTGFDPERTLFLDDNEKNIAAGKALGLRTALVGKRVKSKEADYLVEEEVSNLREMIKEIWGEEEEEMKKTMRADVDSIRTANPVGA